MSALSFDEAGARGVAGQNLGEMDPKDGAGGAWVARPFQFTHWWGVLWLALSARTLNSPTVPARLAFSCKPETFSWPAACATGGTSHPNPADSENGIAARGL